MQGFERYAAILRLFSETRAAWSAPEIAEALAVPQSSIYRTLRELVAENFLEPASGACFRLGAGFIEFERLIRLTDPFLKTGEAMLADMVENARIPCVAPLARLHKDRVMCVASRASASAPATSYERGRPMPLTKGATSKAILAHLPARRLDRLIEEEPEPDVLRAALKDIRKRGYCVSRSEIDPGALGIAAPIVAPALGLVGSMSLVLAEADVDDALERRLVLLTVAAARMVQEALVAA